MTPKLFLASLLLLTAAPFAAAQTPEIEQQHREMLYPVVLVETGRGSGSGTVIYSGPHDDEVHTYVLTNHHVIASAITVREEWDSRTQEDVRRETRRPVDVSWFDYNEFSRAIGTRGRTADIVAYDATTDLALLRTRDRETAVEYVATLQHISDPLYIFEQTWAVGAGLGKPPFPTTGLLSNMDERIDGQRFILSSAPIVFGNSGGALFHYHAEDGGYELIGVPAAVSVTGFGQAVTHMAWSIPTDTIREFLAVNCVGWIVGSAEGDECTEGVVDEMRPQE